jgi:Beta-galactosidase trimerisation domain
LLEGRFLFDFLHEEDLPANKLNKYKTVLLPNIALLSDAECAALKTFVQNGGSVMASFETGLYNERNERRKDSVLVNCSVFTRQVRDARGSATRLWVASRESIRFWTALLILIGCRSAVVTTNRSSGEPGDDCDSAVRELPT